MKMTDPITVNHYVEETKIDLLTVTIGNVHGKYHNPPNLDFARLEQINRQLDQLRDTPRPHLVLHGASGLPSEMTKRAMELGIVKFNVNTDLRTAALRYLKDEVTSSVKEDGKGKKVSEVTI